MNTFLFAAALVLGQLSVDVSPDRVEAVSYIDEPLIVRVRGLATGRHTLEATITSDLGEERSVQLGSYSASNGAPVYVSIAAEELPVGPVAIHVTAVNGDAGDAVTVYRLHRPAKEERIPVVFVLDTVPENGVDHAVEVPVNMLEFSADSGSALAFQQSIALPYGVIVGADESGTLEEVAARFADAETWTIPVRGDVGFAHGLAALMGARTPRPEIVLAPENVDALAAYVALEGFTVPDAIVVGSVEEIHAHRVVMEQSGHEFVEYRTGVVSHVDGIMSGQGSLTRPRLATFGSETSLEARTHLNLWSRFLVGYDVVGEYAAGDGARGVLFRNRTHSGGWLIGLSSEAERAWNLPEGLAAEEVLSASLNVQAGAPEFLTLGPEPVFLLGSAPDVLIVSLSNQIQMELKTLLAVESYVAILPGTLKIELQTLLEQSPMLDSRTALLGILRALPQFEGAMRDGAIPRHVVVPVIARLARVSRLMMALSEAETREFLEPSATMLAQSNRIVARFMSRHPDVERDSRAGQLVREIASLTEEASGLEADGLKIESAGVAMLAIWRSRCLAVYGEE